MVLDFEWKIIFIPLFTKIKKKKHKQDNLPERFFNATAWSRGFSKWSIHIYKVLHHIIALNQ